MLGTLPHTPDADPHTEKRPGPHCDTQPCLPQRQISTFKACGAGYLHASLYRVLGTLPHISTCCDQTRCTPTPGCSCKCVCHRGGLQTTTAVFDKAYQSLCADKSVFRSSVHQFRTPGFRSSTAIKNVQFVVFEDDNGKGFGVRIESADGQRCGNPSQALARPGDVLGLIAGVVYPPGCPVVDNWFTWNLRSDSEFCIYPKGLVGVLDGSRSTTVASLINAPCKGELHNCCAVSHPQRAFMLLSACQELRHGDVLRLSYAPDATQHAAHHWTLFADVMSDTSAGTRHCVCTQRLLHSHTTGNAQAVPASKLHALRVWGVYASISAAQRQELPVTALEWANAPLRCIYAVTEGENDADVRIVPNLLYEPSTAMLHVGVGTQGKSLRVPVEALPQPEALQLYVNLHRWSPGDCLQQLSLAEVPPLRPALHR